ncbi:hypothetical protein [Solirubrobacter soli]|uniref:hypothetical protein n=1 Tax=Solirubrobacter soli TaxID=363832 RepID=UPI0004233B7A|nr:hypothetical protein [Solirubrobacter soli]
MLETLESFPPGDVIEAFRREPAAWKRAGERLHPFEYLRRYPQTATAFAVLRRTRPDERLAMTATGPVTVTWERIRARTWGTLIEEALVAGELEVALRLAAQRPDELAARFLHLLRRALAERPAEGTADASRNHRPLAPAVIAALHDAAPDISAPRRRALTSAIARADLPAALRDACQRALTTGE